MAVVKLLGISKVASQYIGEAGGGEGAKLKEFWQSAFNFQYLFDLVEQLFLSVRASLAFLVLWSFSIFKKAVSKRWELAPLVYLGFGSVSKGWFCLGCIYLICWKWLLSLNSRFGSDVSLWLAAITLSQFHFLFYSSRPLPNIMVIIQRVQLTPLLSVSSSCTQALVPVLLCLSCWLRDLHTGFLLTASFAILIFRSMRIPMC